MFYKHHRSHFKQLNPKWLPLPKQCKIGAPHGEHLRISRRVRQHLPFLFRMWVWVGPVPLASRPGDEARLLFRPIETLRSYTSECQISPCSSRENKRLAKVKENILFCIRLDVSCLWRKLCHFSFPQGIISIYLLANRLILKPLPHRGNTAGLVA